MVLAGEASGLAGTPEAAAAKAFSEAVKSGVANDLNRLASELQKRNGLEVQVQNVALAQLEQVKVALESMAGVQEVYLRSYEDHVAQLQVMTNQLASQDVAKQLSQSEKLNLDVVKINAQMIILKSSFTQ